MLPKLDKARLHAVLTISILGSREGKLLSQTWMSLFTGSSVAVFLNNLGSTSLLEMNILAMESITYLGNISWWMDAWVDWLIDWLIDGWMSVWMGRWMSVYMWMDEWMDGLYSNIKDFLSLLPFHDFLHLNQPKVVCIQSIYPILTAFRESNTWSLS